MEMPGTPTAHGEPKAVEAWQARRKLARRAQELSGLIVAAALDMYSGTRRQGGCESVLRSAARGLSLRADRSIEGRSDIAVTQLDVDESNRRLDISYRALHRVAAVRAN